MPRKKWLKRLTLGVISSTIIYTLWVTGEREWVKRRGNRELASAIAEADATDADWRWDTLNANRKFPPVETNSALLIPRIKAMSSRTWGSKLHQEGMAARLNVAPNIRLPSDILDKAKMELSGSNEALGLARRLAGMPFGNRELKLLPDVLSTPLEDTQHTRHAVELLRWSLETAVDDGDYRELAGDLQSSLNASRSIGDEPFLISQLVRLMTRTSVVRSIERVLAHTIGNAELRSIRLKELQEALERDAVEPLLLYGVRGDRASFSVLFENLENGTIDVGSLGSRAGPGTSLPGSFSIGWWLYRGRLPGDRAYSLRWFTHIVESAKKPIHEQPAKLTTLVIPDRDDKNHLLSRLLLPAVNKVATAFWRSVAEAHCAVLGIACERFRLQFGRWPTALAELDNDMLSKQPIDPYSGKPFLYERLDDGILIYSVGSVMDANGRLLDRAGLPNEKGLGFRLWDTAARRQPAPPEPAPPPEYSVKRP